MKKVIHWFRRDLRIADNTALHEAYKRSEVLLPLFILDDSMLNSPDRGAVSLHCLLQSLQTLRQNLAGLGFPLIVRSGNPEQVLPDLCRELKPDAVFCNREYEPNARKRDTRLFNLLNERGVGFEIFKDAVVWEELEVATLQGKPYTVFTPYSKSWKTHPIPPPRPTLGHAQKRLPTSLATLILDNPEVPSLRSPQHPVPSGEQDALHALECFIEENLFSYGQKRDYPALDATSHLSSFLHFGSIGIRTILAQWKKARNGASKGQAENADVFLNELIWREFYIQIMSNFPHVLRSCFRPEYDGLVWEDNPTHFQAWCEGQTGYPIIDASMRCLNATGWLHNRCRMLVAMFLTKDLMLPWQWGERYFMQRLVDGDCAANNGGWQWSAGTGNDAAPYFRIFNPVTQGVKYDPEGHFVRRWIPELVSLPSDCIHTPWKTSGDSLRNLHYPSRIVIHEEQRPRCLAMFQAVKSH